MQTNDVSAPRVDVHLTPDDLRHALRTDAARGLRTAPKDIPPKWFYDDRGSQLFDEITRLPEYYPTRCERTILEARASDIARITSADTLVELGSGTSDKTRLLLVCPKCQVVREAGIPTCANCGLTIRIEPRAMIVATDGPPPGGAAAA